MKKFMDKDFLLTTETSKKLYHDYAEVTPIIDYHCHINPKEIAEDKKYKLIGSDVYTDLNISPWEAALGSKVEIDAIDETIGVYVPQGIETGEEIHIPDKGYKDGKGGRGEFIIKIKIMIPKNISDKELELYKQMKKISKFNPRDI